MANDYNNWCKSKGNNVKFDESKAFILMESILNECYENYLQQRKEASQTTKTTSKEGMDIEQDEAQS